MNYTDPTGHCDATAGSFSGLACSLWLKAAAYFSGAFLAYKVWQDVGIARVTSFINEVMSSGGAGPCSPEERAATGSCSPRSYTDPYLNAKSGGKHSGFYKQYVDKDSDEIQKGIRSIEKQIQEHLEKIKDPAAHVEGWDKVDPREQEALLTKKWPSDIERQMEQKLILEGILKERNQ